MENDRECWFAAFYKCVPFNIKKPKTNDWGIFLCLNCLNSELKIEALNGWNLLPPVSLEDDLSDLSEQFKRR